MEKPLKQVHMASTVSAWISSSIFAYDDAIEDPMAEPKAGSENPTGMFKKQE